jgi:hypothetical protein
VEDGLDVSQRPLMAPVLARRRNGGEGKQGAKEVLGWQRHFTTGEEARWELRPPWWRHDTAVGGRRPSRPTWTGVAEWAEGLGQNH